MLDSATGPGRLAGRRRGRVVQTPGCSRWRADEIRGSELDHGARTKEADTATERARGEDVLGLEP